MIKLRQNRWCIVLALFWCIAYIVLFIYSFFQYPGFDTIDLTPMAWSFNDAFRLWVSSLPAVSVAALLVSFSLLFRGGGGTAVLPGVMVWGLILTLVFAFSSEVFRPMSEQKIEDAYFRSRSVRLWTGRAVVAEEEGRLVDAVRAYGRALSYRPDDSTLSEAVERLEGQVVLQENSQAALDDEAGAWNRRRYLSEAADAVEKAEAAYGAGDYFTAHYWAKLAAEWDPEQREKAMRIAGRAWDAIGDLSPSEDEKTEKALYDRKLSAYRALREGRPILAYKIFLELAADAQAFDPDIEEFLLRSREAASRASYDITSADQARLLSGAADIYFREPSDGPMLYIGKMVLADGRLFLIDLEFFYTDDEGDALLHFTAPAAMYREGAFLLKGIDPDTGMVEALPELYSGQQKLYRGEGWQVDLETGVLELSTSPAMMRSYAGGRSSVSAVDLLSLYRMAERDSDYGYLRFPAALELLYRGSMPFFFLNMLVLSVGLGLLLRCRGQKPPVIGYLFLPLVPLLSYLLIDILSFLMRLVIAELLLLSSFSLAMTALLVVHAMVLLGVLLFAAGRRDD